MILDRNGGLKMSYDLSEKLVVAISSRALFNMEKENEKFECFQSRPISIEK